MSKPSLDIFEGVHAGRAAAILGGGPSMPDDVKRLPKDCVLFSIKHHGAKLLPCDYTAFFDIRYVDQLRELGTRCGTILSNFVNHTDVLLLEEHWKTKRSGPRIAKIAAYMGCAPVILCGMDCYRDVEGSPYWHGAPATEFTDLAVKLPLEAELVMWRECFKNMRNPEVIKAMSGPLVDVFGAYEKVNMTR